jgi:exopolysaccharide biosynthesis predicted pyruvyltransferase EpsI
LPAGNYDLSDAGFNDSSVFEFFDVLSQYAVIHTDRLHIAIASCLLGREVHLYPNSYFKNRAIFRSSLQGYFSRVHFHDAPPPHDSAEWPEELTVAQ